VLPNAQRRKVGDITGTGTVETRDALELLRYLAGLTELCEIQLFAANGGSRDVTTGDVLAILKYIAGITERV
jgi:hypothetical protein